MKGDEMAHFAKYTKAACGHMLKHYERAKDENGNYIKFGNEKIRPMFTWTNYNLGPEREESQIDFIRKRCSEVRCQNRADVNVLCSWIITRPKELEPEKSKTFFVETYNFLEKRYGKENVVSSYVHMDETTPHMHFAFVPVVEDKKRGGYKVSAKEKVNRNDLQKFHGDLSKHMEKVFGRDIGILNDATKEGNKSIEELKRGTAISRMLEIESRSYIAQKDIEKSKEVLNDLERDKNRLQDELRSYKGILNDLSQKENFIKEFSPQKSLMGGIKGVTIEDIEILKEIALDGLNANQRVQEANKTIECLEIKNNSLESLNKKLYEEKSELIEKAEVNYKKGYEKATKEWDEFEWERNKQMVKDGFNWDTEIYPYGIYEKDSIGHILEEIRQEREIRKSQDWDLEL